MLAIGGYTDILHSAACKRTNINCRTKTERPCQKNSRFEVKIKYRNYGDTKARNIRSNEF